MSRGPVRPLLGLGYLLLLVGLVATSIAAYQKALPWQDAATVSLTTRHTGLELKVRSDVEFQGALVGEVRRVTSDGTAATLELAIDHDMIDQIPADVDAMIVPKTLFGEKYVDLRVPRSGGSATPLADGGRIMQSEVSVELGTIFDRLVPVLRTLDPAKLSTVLGSLADALEGQGDDIARALVSTERLLGRLEPSYDDLVTDIGLLAQASELYADITPDLVATLDDAASLTRTDLVPHEADLAALLDSVSGTATTAEEVLRENSVHLVRLTGRSRPVLELLDTYASVFPCVLETLNVGNNLANLASGARGPVIGLSVDMIVDKEAYTYPDDLPSNPDADAHDSNLPVGVPDWDPHCPRLPERVDAVPRVAPYTWQPYAQAVSPGSDTGRTDELPRPGSPGAGSGAGSGSSHGAGPAAGISDGPLGASIQLAREALARATAAQGLGVSGADVPGYATLLLLPLVAEGEVSLP